MTGKTDNKGRIACDRRSQRVNDGLFRVCSRGPFSLEETGPDQIAPAAWLNGLSKRKGKPQLEGKGKYTVAAESLGSVVGVRKGSCCRCSMCMRKQKNMAEPELVEGVVRAPSGSAMTCEGGVEMVSLCSKLFPRAPQAAAGPLMNLYSSPRLLFAAGNWVPPLQLPHHSASMHCISAPTPGVHAAASADHGGVCLSARQRHVKRPRA